MSRNDTPDVATAIQGKHIRRYPLVVIAPAQVHISPTLAHDAHIVPNIAHDALLRPGLRLNPEAWEVYESEKKA